MEFKPKPKLGTDVERREQAELRVESGEEIFRLLVDAVDEYAIFALDPSGRILTWNLGGQRLKGYLAAEVIGTHFHRFYPPEDIARRHPEFELGQAQLKGKYEEEGWRIKKDGSRFWANVVITALRDKHGVLRGFGKVTRDLTQKRKTELDLRESEERFRLMVDGVQDYAIFMLDPEGSIKTWNQGAQRNKGYSAEEILGQHFSIFYPESDLREGKPAMELREALRLGRYEDEGWRVRKDGTRFWANVVLTPIWDSNRALLGYAKVTRNLTERKRAEEELREAYTDLEQRVQERTRELFDAKSRAEEAVKARDQFFSLASHELKTPLASLLMQAELRARNVKRGKLEGFTAERLPELFADDIRLVKKLATLVDRMFDISRVTSGAFEIRPEGFNLAEMAADVTARMAPILAESGIELRFSAPKPVNGFWDRVSLEQVLMNLLTNAGRYAPGKPVLVSVTGDAEFARISVKDHGPGISKDKQALIFEPFERGESFNRDGLGLGLYVVKKIVKLHGGDVHVESELGQGAKFFFDFPLKVEVNVE